MSTESRALEARAGVTLVEALAALTLSSLVMTIVVGMCVAQLRLARATAERAVAADATRTVITVLSGEARRMTQDDVRAVSSDSIALRAFRGMALPCGTTTSGVLVRYTGDRLPDETKDSVLVLSPPHDRVDRLSVSQPAPGSCPVVGDETVFEWSLASGGPPGAVLLLFESGSYHLSGRAFRYRIGAAGRQPLTPEVLTHPGSRFDAITAAGLRFTVETGGLAHSLVASFAGGLLP